MNKISITAVIVLALFLGYICFGDDLGSVTETAVKKTRESADVALGLDFKIDRAEHALSEADGELRDNQRQVAEIQVKTEDLTRELEGMEKREAEIVSEISVFEDLYQKTGHGKYTTVFRDKEVEGPVVERALQLHLDRLSNLRQQIATRITLVDKHEIALEDSREILAQKEFTKERLELQAETIRFELDAIEMSEALHGLSGDSSLSQAQALITEVDKELRVRTIIIDDQKDPFEEIVGNYKPVGEELLEMSRNLTETL